MSDRSVEAPSPPSVEAAVPPAVATGSWAARRRRGGPPLTVVVPWSFLVILFVVYAVLEPSVLTLSQLGNVGTGALVLMLIAVGQTIVILTSGIDLSVGGTMGLGCALLATQMHSGTVVPWVVGVLVIGAIVGAGNGLIITYFAMQPFIVTLATWSMLDGLALIVLPAAGGTVPTSFATFIYSTVFGLPVSLFLMLVLAAFWLWLKRTPLVRRMYAIGSDEDATALSGVPIKRTKIAAYALCGSFAMAAAILYTMQTSSGDPAAGDPFILTSVAAAVIGGTSLFGGRGGAGGTIAGAWILTLIADVIFAVNISQFWTPIVQGLLLILAVLAGAVAERRTRQLERSL